MTTGTPLVTVPVLSRATIWVRPAASSEAAVLKRMPLRAPRPLPAMMATGVARPKAQGQLMTKTAIPRAAASPTGAPKASHTAAVMAARAMTTGTKTPDTRSAILAMGAFVAAASSMRRMIWARVVSSPTRAARQRRKPDWFSVAEATSSPGPLSMGRLSPVSAASFTALVPSTTTPSTGMVSPGRTTKMSPALTSPTGTVVSAPSLRSVAVWGASCKRLFRASVVFPLARASSIFPTVMRATIMAADSK